jgi:membrane-bound serine protease (ClpP class)
MDPLSIAYVLIAIGLIFLAAEVFVPSLGILFVLGTACLVGGVAMTFIYAPNPYLPWLTLGIITMLVPVGGYFLFQLWPKTVIGKRIILQAPTDDESALSMPVHVELEQLRGRIGRALSSLRPAGVADFDGRRIDVITEGMMIDAGEWVRCIDVRAGRVLVRKVDKPDLGKLEDADFSS